MFGGGAECRPDHSSLALSVFEKLFFLQVPQVVPQPVLNLHLKLTTTVAVFLFPVLKSFVKVMLNKLFSLVQNKLIPHWYSASRQSFGVYKGSSEPSVTVHTRELLLLMCCEGCYRHGCNRSIVSERSHRLARSLWIRCRNLNPDSS